MATRHAEALAMVRRAQKAGWRTEPMNDGWKVWDRTGRQHVVHMTPSDVNSFKQKLRDWEAGGLLESEKEAAEKAAEEKARKLAEGRANAASKARQLASRSNLAKKAAGPYLTEVEECDLAWLTGDHPSPWMKWMYITPTAAAHLLEHYNTDNRKILPSAVERYKLAILSGQWHMTHQGLAIDTRGILQDGQHRLSGVVEAGDIDEDVKVPFAVFVGMPVENFKAIDEGRLRNAGQMFAKGGAKNSAVLVSCLRLVTAYRSESPREFMRQKLSTVAAYEILSTDPDRFQEAADWGVKHFRRTKITNGPLAAIHYLLKKTNGDDNPYVTAFLEGLVWNRKHNTELILPDDDPRRVLLSRFNNTRPAPIETLFILIHGWNNLVRGHHPSYMRISDQTPPPTILVCKPGEGATPRGLYGEV